VLGSGARLHRKFQERARTIAEMRLLATITQTQGWWAHTDMSTEVYGQVARTQKHVRMAELARIAEGDEYHESQTGKKGVGAGCPDGHSHRV
jgi:hypothetical protein